jgi:hypothetical protein
MNIAIVNESTLITAREAQAMTMAVNLQLKRDFCPLWEIVPSTVTYYASYNLVPPKMPLILIEDESDIEGALGYHTETLDNRTIGFVFAGTILQHGGSVLKSRSGEYTVAAVLSHEVLEMVVDPNVNMWADGPTIEYGWQYCYECCDPVESDFYNVTVRMSRQVGLPAQQVSVSVSDFVLPAWFDSQAPNGVRCDFMRLLTTPFHLRPYGYMIVRDPAAGDVWFVFGAKRPLEWRIHAKIDSLRSRTHRRGVGAKGGDTFKAVVQLSSAAA